MPGNLQTIPKKRIDARKPFIPAQGFTFLSADYSNLEVRILAYETKDQILIEMLESGADIHAENVKILFQIEKGQKNYEIARRAAKIFMFGGISYGGSDREIYEQVCLEAPELRLTFSGFKEAKDRYVKEHPAYKIWYDEIEQSVYSTRTTQTFQGRVRTLMGNDKSILKQALNTPIQGGAGGIINQALIKIVDRMDERRCKSRILLQIHDELLFEMWHTENEWLMEMVREEMERPVDFKGRTVIFPTEQKTGKDWGSLT